MLRSCDASHSNGDTGTQLCDTIPAPHVVRLSLSSGVQVVYACNTRSLEQVAGLRDRLAAAGCMSHTAIVACAPDAPLGEKYAAMCTACTIGGVWVVWCAVVWCGGGGEGTIVVNLGALLGVRQVTRGSAVITALLYRRLRFCKLKRLQMQEISRTKRT